LVEGCREPVQSRTGGSASQNPGVEQQENGAGSKLPMKASMNTKPRVHVPVDAQRDGCALFGNRDRRADQDNQGAGRCRKATREANECWSFTRILQYQLKVCSGGNGSRGSRPRAGNGIEAENRTQPRPRLD
jgi:hypothetical protein